MSQTYSETVIEVETNSGQDDQRIHVGIERSYIPSGRDNMRKTGPWQVRISQRFSDVRLPPQYAQALADAILLHAVECERRNAPPDVAQSLKVGLP